jgi:cell division control protein 6
MESRDLLLSDQTLFRDESVFTPGYVPEEFIHRDNQLRELEISLKPGLRGMNPVNTLVHGPPGTGKTTAVRFLFRRMGEVTQKVIPVYINCEDFETPYSIFASIYRKIYGLSPPSTGKPLESIKEKVFTKLLKDEKSLVVALDEMDHLFMNNNINGVLIDLLKSHVTYGYDKLGVVGIMIDEDYMIHLDEKTRSVFNPARVFFHPYTREEIHDILSRRVKSGFYEGVMSPSVLDDVVDKTLEGGDLRSGIEFLRRSALLAEHDSTKEIREKHVKKAYEGNMLMKKNRLSADDEGLLRIISESSDHGSGFIYKKFREDSGIGITKYNELVKKLEHKKLIKTEYVKGKRGRRRDITAV